MRFNLCNYRAYAFAVLLLVVNCGVGRTLFAQGNGAITFLNAVPLETPTFFYVNGNSLRSKGFTSGFCTSALVFKAAPQTIVAKNGDLQSEPLIVNPSQTSSPLAVASLVLKEDKETKEMKPKLILVAAANLANGKGSGYQVFYSSVKPSTDFTFNGQTVTMKGGEGKNFLDVDGAFKIEVAGKKLATYNAQEPGNFFVILYDKPDGSIGVNIAQDRLYFAAP